MKKLFIAALALASVACTKSEVLETAPQKAISFGKPFVENATKAIDPSLTHGDNGTFTTFNVYGTLTNTATPPATTNIFNGVEVVKVSDATHTIGATGTWYYNSSSVQYWIPGNTYNFVAVAKATKVNVDAANNNMPTTLEYTADGTTDLLYTKTPVTKTPDVASFDETVAFTFDHLLSKVVFKFTNDYATDASFVIKVTDIAIKNAAASGVYTVDGGVWAKDGSKEFTFGNAPTTATAAGAAADYIASEASLNSNFERLLVPGTYSGLQIAFKAEVYLKQGEKYTLVDTKDYTQAGKYLVPSNSITIDAGKAYSFNVEIGDELQPIKFGVQTLNGFTTVTPDVELN